MKRQKSQKVSVITDIQTPLTGYINTPSNTLGTSPFCLSPFLPATNPYIMFRADSHSPCPHQRTFSDSSANTASEAPKAPKLGMAGVANLFVRTRRAENRIRSRRLQEKPGQTILTSGEAYTHPSVARCVQPGQPRVPVEFAESYICSGGVNVIPLLVASRAALLDRAEAAIGAGTLTDEQYVDFYPLFHM